MSRNDVTQDVVLQRIVARLRSQLELNSQQCYETLNPDEPPTIPKGGNFFVTIGLGDSRFAEGEQVSTNVTEESDVVVVGWTRIQLDPTDHGRNVLYDAKRGLIPLKLKLLKALVGHDLTDASGDTMLRTLLYCNRVGTPTYDKGKKIGFIALTFGVDFDWDLT